MPRAKPLHSKGKVTSIQKPCTVEKDDSECVDPDESVRQFQLELVWCIQQLERTLNEKKGSEKQLQEAWKVLTVLKNNNQPIVRKRQLMRTHFGDYRAKMQAEEKKIAKMASKMKISESPAQPKATFLRKSAFLSTGNEAFRFNFNVSQEQHDTKDNCITPKLCNTDVPISNSDSAVKSETGKTESQNSAGDSKDVKTEKTDFKFNFSNSEFKFNFNRPT